MGAHFLNMFGLTMMYGLLMAMDTLVSQAKGAGNLEMCGVYLNRSRFIITICYIPMVLLSFYVKRILIFFGQDPRVSEAAEQYVHYQIIAIYFLAMNTCQAKFLNNLGKTSVPMISGLIAACLHPLWCFIFISPNALNLSIAGSGLANLMTYLICFIVNVIYSSCLPEISKAIFLPDSRVFHDLPEYFELGVPGAFMISIEVYAYIFINILAGWISVECQSGQVVLG